MSTARCDAIVDMSLLVTCLDRNLSYALQLDYFYCHVKYKL